MLAPDLRGRALSAAVGPPFGLGTHAEDLAAVIRASGVGSAVVAGHSLGAYIAAVLAARRPELVRALVLVDGGLPLPRADIADVDAVLDVTLGPAIERLRRTFATVDEYRAFWLAHPAFAGGKVPDADIFAFADHDLTGEPPALRSTVREEAVRVDGRDLLVDDESRQSADQVTCPITLLLAPKGLLDDPNPLIPRDEVAAFAGRHPSVSISEVAGENHYTVLTGPAGAQAVAAAIREQIGSTGTVVA